MIILIICLGLGLLMIWLSLHEMSYAPKTTILIGLLFIIMGISGFLLSKDIVPYDGEFPGTVCLFVFIYSLAFIFTIAIYRVMADVFKARTPIQAVLVDKVRHGGGLSTLYTLTFSYHYGKRDYTATTKGTISFLAAGKLQPGESYRVKICDQNPTIVIYKWWPGFGTRWMIYLALFFYALPFLLLFDVL